MQEGFNAATMKSRFHSVFLCPESQGADAYFAKGHKIESEREREREKERERQRWPSLDICHPNKNKSRIKVRLQKEKKRSLRKSVFFGPTHEVSLTKLLPFLWYFSFLSKCGWHFYLCFKGFGPDAKKKKRKKLSAHAFCLPKFCPTQK